MKDRYYTICRRLVRTRTTSDPQAQQQLIQSYSFDKCESQALGFSLMAARETKRKQYASELFHLTAAEIAEEEALYVEIKRLEQNERRYRADRDDLLRTVVGLDSDLVDMDQANIETVLGLVRLTTMLSLTFRRSGSVRRTKCLHQSCPGRTLHMVGQVAEGSLMSRRCAVHHSNPSGDLRQWLTSCCEASAASARVFALVKAAITPTKRRASHQRGALRAGN